jgi:hypothetical protein
VTAAPAEPAASKSWPQHSEASAAEPSPEHCETCGDVAARMVVLSADPGTGLALCEDEQRARRTVETALLGEVRPGDALLVHAGTALARAAR